MPTELNEVVNVEELNAVVGDMEDILVEDDEPVESAESKKEVAKRKSQEKNTHLFGITADIVISNLGKDDVSREVIMGAFDILSNCSKCKMVSKSGSASNYCGLGDCLLKKMDLLRTGANKGDIPYNKACGNLFSMLSEFGLTMGYESAGYLDKQKDLEYREVLLIEKEKAFDTKSLEWDIQNNTRRQGLKKRREKYDAWLSLPEDERVSRTQLAKDCGISRRQLIEDFKLLGYPLGEKKGQRKSYGFIE